MAFDLDRWPNTVVFFYIFNALSTRALGPAATPRFIFAFAVLHF